LSHFISLKLYISVFNIFYRVKGNGKQEKLNGLEYEDIGKFLLSGITVVNLTSLEPIWTKILDLTQVYKYYLTVP
jgi:hypothetical protein